MKKIHTSILTCILFLAIHFPGLQAQFSCNNPLHASLGPEGDFVLFQEDVLAQGDPSGYDVTLSQTFFSCSDLGPNAVTLSIFDGSDLIYACTINLIVEDKINPVANCLSAPSVELGANGTHVFVPADIDDGSFDACGIVAWSFNPPQVKCGDPNPIQVTMTVSDASGNTGSCTTMMAWEDYPFATINLACNAGLNLFLVPSEFVEVTPEMMLAGGPYACPDHYEIELMVDNVPRIPPILTLDDTNKVIIASVIEPISGNLCWGDIHVFADGTCGEPFTVCDTECHSAPVGDCASGHTDQDDVEWPCDIYLSDSCAAVEYNPTPNFLEQNGLAEPEDIYPQILNPQCFITSIAYEDVIFIQGDGKRIERTWSIIDWQVGQVYTYLQKIFLSYPGITICDTLPWNTPAGDCASGHTFDDNVEWPADITVHTLFINPADLFNNNEVNAFDAEPQLNDPCGGVLVDYMDEYAVINDTTLDVTRTWVLYEGATNNSWEYVQHITVIGYSTASVVCVTRENGDPIPGVELAPGIVTDETGCYSFSDPNGIIVTPVKDSPLQDGVNLLDKIVLMEGLLGIQNLSIYQQYAGDLNQSFYLSAIDVVEMDKLIAGTLMPVFDHNWMFYEQSTQAHHVDISNPLYPYHFIGVKMGDLDNSFPLPFQPGMNPISLVADDEILNKKEQYQIPFSLGQNARILGFTLTIQNPSGEISFSKVTAPNLPGFDQASHTTITPGELKIDYIVPQDYLEFGVPLTEGDPLFVVELSPAVNSILHEELVLSSENDNLLRSTSTTTGLTFNFSWENEISSAVLGVEDGIALEFYPNPVREELHFKGLTPDMEGNVFVYDAMGRLCAKSVLENNVDLSSLQEGMYYLQLQLKNGKSYSAPFLKQ